MSQVGEPTSVVLLPQIGGRTMRHVQLRHVLVMGSEISRSLGREDEVRSAQSKMALWALLG